MLDPPHRPEADERWRRILKHSRSEAEVERLEYLPQGSNCTVCLDPMTGTRYAAWYDFYRVVEVSPDAGLQQACFTP